MTLHERECRERIYGRLIVAVAIGCLLGIIGLAIHVQKDPKPFYWWPPGYHN